MYVLGTYGSPDIAIATYTCTFIHTHTQLNASNTNTHTHSHMLGWARQTTFEQNSQLFTTRGSQKLFAIAEAAAAVTHHKYKYTYTHTHADTHACKTRAAASPSSLYHNLRERLKSL